MRHYRLFCALMALAGLSACSREPEVAAQVQSIECAAARAADPRAYEETAWPLLQGDFDFTRVDTAARPVWVGSAILTLAAVDSAERHPIRPIIWRQFRPLAGEVGRTMATSSLDARAEVEAKSLLIGCRDCLHPEVVRHRIEGVSSAGFWGHWIRSSDMTRIVDRQGRDYTPAGTFCAIRKDRDPAS